MSTTRLDFDAARALLAEEAAAKPTIEFDKWLRKTFPAFVVLKGKEHSERFRVHFSAKIGLHHSVHRMTGGCGNMKPEGWSVIENAIKVLNGESQDGSPQPKARGLCLHGGTRMLFKAQPDLVRPGVTEIFPAIADCPKATVVGVVSRVSKMFLSDYGMVMSPEPDCNYFTIVHPHQTAIAILEKNSDEPYDDPWWEETLRCSDIVGELQEAEWPVLLSSIGGGGVTKKEIEHWASLSKQDGNSNKWPILLIKGAGGSTDAFAADEAWLKEHKNVHVCGGSVEEIRQAWLELGAIG